MPRSLRAVILVGVVAALASACAAIVGVSDVPLPTEGGQDTGASDVSHLDVDGGSDTNLDSSVNDSTMEKDPSVPETGNAEGGNADASEADAPLVTESTQPWWPNTNGRGCMSAGMPKASDRPDASDPGPDLPVIYLAISRTLFGSANDDPMLTPDASAWENIGFDMDGVCTNSSTCVDPKDPSMNTLIDDTACRNANLVPYDGNLCRDNQIGKLYGTAANDPILGPHFGVTEQDWNCELHRGGFGSIFKISGYNGKLNDMDVRLDMYVSTGLVTLPTWSCRANIDSPLDPAWYMHAGWLPTDRWTIAQQSVDMTAPTSGTDLPNAIAADPAAYVRNGWLVAQLPGGAQYWLPGDHTAIPGYRVTMHRGIVVGRLAQGTDGTWNITDGTLAFVSLPNEEAEAFREMGFCENMCQGYQQLKNYLNDNQDILSTSADILPNTPCDALTSGNSFTARQATALSSDIAAAAQPTDCPEPRSALVPRQGCTCQSNGVCTLDGGGADAADAGSGSD